MRVQNLLAVLTGFTALAFSTSSFAADWRIQGDLVESCTCGVPCSCNFGAGPAPFSFCYALFSIDIKEGHYNDVKLDGLHLGGGGGDKGLVWYIDERADEKQAQALRNIGDAIYAKVLKANGVKSIKDAPKEFQLLGYKKSKIEQ